MDALIGLQMLKISRVDALFTFNNGSIARVYVFRPFGASPVLDNVQSCNGCLGLTWNDFTLWKGLYS